VQVKRTLIVQRPDRPPFLATTWGSRAKLFPPQDRLPGAWHRVCVEVTPDGATAYCALDPADGLEPIDTVAASRLSAELSSIPEKATFFTKHPEAVPTNMPNWQPRMPIGIWCSQAAVAVKNVVIEAIP
jgi:hypothetical protein